jgi:hypothetical protein
MTYIITYSNHFKIANTIFAFRKKELFEISKTPIYKKQIEVSGCKGYWLKGKFYSLSKLKELIVNEPVDVDVSGLQWHKQIELDEVFNLV